MGNVFVPEKGYRLERPNGTLVTLYWDEVPDGDRDQMGVLTDPTTGKQYFAPSFVLVFNPSAGRWFESDPHPVTVGPEPSEGVLRAIGPRPHRTEAPGPAEAATLLKDWEQKAREVTYIGEFPVPEYFINFGPGLGYLVDIGGREQVLFPEHAYTGIGSRGRSVSSLRFYEIPRGGVEALPKMVPSAFQFRLLNHNVLPEHRYPAVPGVCFEAVEAYQSKHGDAIEDISDIVTRAMVEGAVPDDL